MTHRRATADDLDLLASWNHQLIQDEGHRNPMTVDELRNRMDAWLQGEYEAFIFEVGTVPAAYALCRRDGDALVIRHLFVDRDQRRRGFGHGAVEILVSDVYPEADRLMAEVLVQNAGGRAFWKAAGFDDYAVVVERFRR